MTTSEIFAQQNQRRKNTATASGVAKPEVKKRLLSAATVGGTADGDGKAARRQPRIQLYRPPAAAKKHVTTEATGGNGSGRSSTVAPPRGTKQSKAAANSSETVAAVTKDWFGVKTLSEILHAKQQQRRKLRDQQQADVSDDDVDVAASTTDDVAVSETSHINESTSKRTMTSHKVIGSNVILTTVSDNTAVTAAAATGATSKRRIQRNVCGQHVTTQAAQRRHSRVR